jgi:hypothetical protein
MLSRQEDDRERREVLRNDQRVRQQQEQAPRVFADQSIPRRTGTYMSHTHDDAGGRFSAISNVQIVGQSAVPNYPAAAAHQADPCGTEPPLGYRIDALDPSDPVEPSIFTQQATGEPASRDRVRSPVPLADLERVDVGSPPLSHEWRRF